MLTDVQIINLGLSKLAAARVNRIDPAVTPLERYMASNYPQWRTFELTKRRWRFALTEHYQLVQVAILENVRKPYKYNMPNDCLRPVRGKRSEWAQVGRFIYSCHSSLCIDYIRNVPESEFDPLFNEVLANKIQYESCEYVTQSTSKRQAALLDYDRSVLEAAQANAYVTGPEDVGSDDSAYGWLQAHHYGQPVDTW